MRFDWRTLLIAGLLIVSSAVIMNEYHKEKCLLKKLIKQQYNVKNAFNRFIQARKRKKAGMFDPSPYDGYDLLAPNLIQYTTKYDITGLADAKGRTLLYGDVGFNVVDNLDRRVEPLKQCSVSFNPSNYPFPDKNNNPLIEHYQVKLEEDTLGHCVGHCASDKKCKTVAWNEKADPSGGGPICYASQAFEIPRGTDSVYGRANDGKFINVGDTNDVVEADMTGVGGAIQWPPEHEQEGQEVYDTRLRNLELERQRDAPYITDEANAVVRGKRKTNRDDSMQPSRTQPAKRG
jgi:hypothetical protein